MRESFPITYSLLLITYNMKSNILKGIVSLLLLLSLSTGVKAQTPASGDISNQSQDVIKNFDARLIETEKIKTLPVLPAIDTTTKAQSYSVPNKVVNINYQPPKLRPIPVAPQKNDPAYDGYVKVGYGFPNSPFAEGAYKFSQPNQYVLGFYGKYHAAKDNAYIENMRFSDLKLEANGTYFTPANIALDGKIGFEGKDRPYYGYDHSKFTETEASSKQFFNNTYFGAKAYNTTKNVIDVNYSAGLNYYRLTDNYGGIESNIDLRFDASKWFSDKYPLGLTIRTDFTTYDSTGGKTQDLNNYYLQPNFTFKDDNYSIRIGANIVNTKDETFFLPDLEGTLNLGGTEFIIFAGWKGDINKNSYKQLTSYNPYIFTQTKIANTRKTEYYGGIKGSVSQIDYSAQIGYSNNIGLPLYLANNADRFRRFNVLYDTVSITNIRGAVTFHPIPKLDFIGTVSQNVYSTTREKAAWGLPSLDVNATAKYTAYENKSQHAIIKVSAFLLNGVNIKDGTGNQQRLNGIFDLNAGGEFWFLQNVGVFLDVYNLLNIRQQRWENYPSFGLNVLGGVTARF